MPTLRPSSHVEKTAHKNSLKIIFFVKTGQIGDLWKPHICVCVCLHVAYKNNCPISSVPLEIDVACRNELLLPEAFYASPSDTFDNDRNLQKKHVRYVLIDKKSNKQKNLKNM